MQINPVYRYGSVTGAPEVRGPYNSPAPSIVQGIVETSRALGINPADLATVISYETAGTFDPVKAGPTTQWGRHRGLIQFGEPQAREYGVNWQDPVGSQLGENGAIARYLRKAGVRPGMGLLDIYSAVNAGSVGRYNASDANNGGAPGTVRDKVENQMADHRRKAMALLGGDYTPPPADQMQPVGGRPMQQGILAPFQKPEDNRPFMERLKDGARDGSLWDALAIGFNSMRGQFADPSITQMAQGRLDQRQEQAQANATAEWLRANGREDLASAIEGGIISGAQAFDALQGPGPVEGKVVGDMLVDPYTGQVIGDYTQPTQPHQVITGETAAAMGLDPAGAYNLSPDGRVTAIGGGGVNVSVNTGSEVGTIPQGFELITDPETGARSMRPIPGGPEDKSKSDAVAAANRGTSTDIITSAAARAREAAGQRALGGYGQSIGQMVPWTDAAEVARQVEVLKANAKIENLTAMREASPTGGALGAVSDSENAMLAAKAGALDPSSPNFLRDLEDYERTLLRTVHGAEAGDRIFEQTRKKAGEEDTGPSDDDLLKKYGG